MSRERLGAGLLAFTGWVLIGSGLFAIYLAFTTTLLPHDVAYLGFTVDSLCAYFDCRVVSFLAHDRVAFGGSIIAVGVLYHWLATAPLRKGEPWAWWAGFGGGLFSGGLAILFIALYAIRPGDSALWLALATSGAIGFGCAIGIHFVVGYTSFSHLLPAFAGALTFAAAVVTLFPDLVRNRARRDA